VEIVMYGFFFFIQSVGHPPGSTVNTWKADQATPREKTLEKLTHFFHVWGINIKHGPSSSHMQLVYGKRPRGFCSIFLDLMIIVDFLLGGMTQNGGWLCTTKVCRYKGDLGHVVDPADHPKKSQ
jgi:hypothetical protein